MKLLIDTHVWLDVALKREGFFENSYVALCECIDANDEVYVAATSLKDVFYIVAHLENSKAAYQAVESILSIARATTIDDGVCRNALPLERPDYEDGLIAASMNAESIDTIITHDKKAFHNPGYHSISPADFIADRGYEALALNEDKDTTPDPS